MREAIEPIRCGGSWPEYRREFSAYRAATGPGFRAATQHAGTSRESTDRLAVGNQHSEASRGAKAAPRATPVEIRRCGREVRRAGVRTLQDPEPYAHLPYAVVTGREQTRTPRRKGARLSAGPQAAARSR